MKDLGLTLYFLSFKIHHTAEGIIVNQRKFITNLLIKSGLIAAKLTCTPLPTNASLYTEAGSELVDASLYRQLV